MVSHIYWGASGRARKTLADGRSTEADTVTIETHNRRVESGPTGSHAFPVDGVPTKRIVPTNELTREQSWVRRKVCKYVQGDLATLWFQFQCFRLLFRKKVVRGEGGLLRSVSLRRQQRSFRHRRK